MILSCVIIFVFSGLVLLWFNYINKNRKIERWYYRNNLLLFALLEFCLFLLVVSVVMNGRFIFDVTAGFFAKNVFKRLLSMIKK